MARFKKGDKVRRIAHHEVGGFDFSEVYTVAVATDHGLLGIEGLYNGSTEWLADNFELVEPFSPIDEEIESVQADKATAKNRLFDLRLLRSLANDNGYTLTKEA